MGVVPPLVDVAVNATLVPAQISDRDETMLMVGVTAIVTIIVMLLLVTVVEVVHAALVVSTQTTTSLLLNVLDVNVEALVPTFTPFTFHW